MIIIGIINIMIVIIIIDDFNISGNDEFNFDKMNDFCGPYISCHILSLFWNNIIIGWNIFDEITDR